MQNWDALLAGVGILLIAWALYRASTGEWNPLKLIDGADGRPSTSKGQWFFWTVAVLYAYVCIYYVRAKNGNFAAIQEIPSNLLITMGLSGTTMALAKGITSYKVSVRSLNKTAAPAPAAGKANANQGSLINDDDGYPALSKIQVLAWNGIAIIIFLIEVFHTVVTAKEAALLGLPDIDGSLMALMGVGQAAYLGKKMADSHTPRLTGLSKGATKPGEEIIIFGEAFGESQNGSQITFDRTPVEPAVKEWLTDQVKFVFPAKMTSGDPWTPGQKIMVSLVVNGKDDINSLPLSVAG